MGKKRKRQGTNDAGPQIRKRPHNGEVVPDGIFHYWRVEDVPWDTQIYFRQRYKIFSRYNEGIWMTGDAWYGVTQEAIATKLADHIASAAPANRSIILDPFCGVGGNTIAFALSGRWKRVYAIEKDPATLECAMQNARIYGVHDQITWFEGDCFDILGLKDDNKEKEISALKSVIDQYGVVFASPPWGGPAYKDEHVFNLDNMQPYSLRYMFDKFRGFAKNMVFYLPRTSDLQQIADCVEKDEKAQVVHYCTNGGSRALCAYLGDWGVIKTGSKGSQ